MTNYRDCCTSLLRGGLLHDPSINQTVDAGWSSPVARQAHNLKVIGSNPIPATKSKARNAKALAGFCMRKFGGFPKAATILSNANKINAFLRRIIAY